MFKAKDIMVQAAKNRMTQAQFMAANGLTGKTIRYQARLRTFLKQIGTDEKATAFVRANPRYFDGSKVQASHILVAVGPTASTEKHKAALTKIRKIEADIKAGKITFEKAATELSDDPNSAAKAGTDSMP